MKAIYLRTARDRKGWTQETLEAESGVRQNVISRLETDSKTQPMFKTVTKLAAALGVDPRALRFGPDPKAQERVAS